MIRRVFLVAVLVGMMSLMVGSAAAGQPDAPSRFWLEQYEPKIFVMQVQLTESRMSVTIKFDNGIFYGGFEQLQSGDLTAGDMTVLADALDYAVLTASAMPE